MKKFIRKVAAVGAGVAMLGSTLGGAMAADLSDLPSPFVTGGAYADTAFVVGTKAGTNDDAARTILTGYFNPFVSTEVGAVVASSKTEKIFIGENITQEFANKQDDGDISSFWDDGIDFRGENYETHEELVASTTGDGVILVSSGLTGEELFGATPRLYTTGGNTSWGYRYVFDENMDKNVSTDNELKISFLGKPIRISDIENSNMKITLTTGEQSAMAQDSSVTVNGHTLHVGTIFQTKAEVWVDDLSHKFMSEGDEETFTIGSDQVEAKLDDIGYTEDVPSRTVLLTYGKDISSAVKDGDAVQTELGEPDVDDDASDALWNWDINVSDDDIFNTSSFIGIEFNQKINKYDDVPAPIGDGESWSTPYGYITLDVEIPEMTYKEYEIYFDTTFDVNSTYEMPAIIFSAVGQASSNDGLDIEGTDTNRIACNATGWCFYEDNNGKFQGSIGYANSTVCEGTNTICIEASSDSTKWIQFRNNTGYSLGTAILDTDLNMTSTVSWVVIEDVESSDESLYTGANISFNVSVANGKLGATKSTAEAGDLYYETVATPYGVTTKREVQSWDEGVVRTMYGSIISGTTGITDENVKGSVESDELHIWVPEDEVYAEVTFNVRATATEVDPVLTTETGATGYDNLILVGGPCVNSLTASYMGLTYPACEAASTITANKAIIKLVEKDSKTALIVAGWEKADTARAASTVANGGLTGTSMTAV